VSPCRNDERVLQDDFPVPVHWREPVVEYL
jgi:hypothetical protein